MTPDSPQTRSAERRPSPRTVRCNAMKADAGTAVRSRLLSTTSAKGQGPAGRITSSLSRGVVAALVALVVMAFGVTACSTNPVTGRSQLMLVPESFAIDASREAYVSMLAPFQREGRVNADRALTARVQGITERIVAQAVRFRPETADWDWQIAVIDSDEANAFAMAGGRMGIYRGIIERLNLTDDELAQIIGHEIGHAISGHTAEKMSVALASQVGVAAFAMTGERSQVSLSAAVLAATLALQLPHSRQMEREADRIGIELAARAGYDPNAAPSLWAKMATLGGRTPAFLSTHPAPADRQRDLAILANQFQPLYLAALREPRLPRHPVR